ncbi:GNAT family N-acetyltransferase [Hyphococcus formosus]|uniref:GNAT family N-acetyltransferase n=1 Tax=Hyphococcus formosus TaxID=3143534 RepID=UPI00398BB812
MHGEYWKVFTNQWLIGGQIMSEELDIKHEEHDRGGRYFAEVKGGTAELTYDKVRKNVINVHHTFVPPESRGGKIAQTLVEKAVEEARTNDTRIIPQCPYVDKLFQRRSDLDEVRAI